MDERSPQLRDVLPGMLATGTGVLVVSVVAFLRVPLLPSIGRDLHMSATDLGVLTTVFAAGRLATDIPAGRLADRFPSAGVLSLAGAVLAAGSLLLASALTPWWAWSAAFVLGVASALTNTTGMTYFSAAVPIRWRATSLSAYSAALLGGQALGPMLGGAIASWDDWRTAQIVGAAIAGGLALALGAWRPLRRATAVPGAPTSAGPDSPSAIPLRERMVLYAVPFAIFFSLGAMPQTLVPVIGDQDLALSAGVIGLALGAGGMLRFVGAVVGGQLADRVSRRAALIPSLTFQGLGIGILALPPTLTLWLAAIAVMSVASYGISTGAAMLADRTGRAGVGRLLGTFRFVGDVGLIIGPALTAFLFERVGRPAAVLTVAGMLVVCALAAAVVLPETRWLSDEPRRGGGARCPR